VSDEDEVTFGDLGHYYKVYTKLAAEKKWDSEMSKEVYVDLIKVFMYLYMFINVHIYTYIYMNICLCIYIFIYIYIYDDIR
jgi:hypothetical protein